MRTDSPTQSFFAGEFRHALDDKNRITIPSRWRRGDGEDFIILPEAKEQFLLVMSHEEFARVIENVTALLLPARPCNSSRSSMRPSSI